MTRPAALLSSLVKCEFLRSAPSAAVERKKRWIEFPAAQSDIDYAVIVLLEAQFKWTPQIEAEIKVMQLLHLHFEVPL